MKRNLFLLVVFLLAIESCENNSQYHNITPQPVNYTVVEKTSAFTPENTLFTIDSINNMLYLHFTIKQLKKDFPFPINKVLNDTLTNTAFNFQFYYNGQTLLSEYNTLKNTVRKFRRERTTPKKELIISTDTTDIRNGAEFFVDIPLYAFHSLKKGKQTLELRIWQETFSDRAEIKEKNDKYSYRHLTEQKKLFDTRIKFEILVPEIYKAQVLGYGLTLKNDSTFSPAGMDNTLWKSSYPDIYWCVVYPKKTIYAQTDYETSTDHYAQSDTFTLYHYYKNDSIGFQVYDHDNLSRDDYLGGWWGGQVPLRVSPAVKDISFDNISNFKVAIKEEGLVN